MTDRKTILLEIVSARLRAEGLPSSPKQFVDDCRPLAREILDRDEAPSPVAPDSLPTATVQNPYDGHGWVGGRWVPVWFDGTTWRRNNSSGADVTATVTYWRTLQAP
jgi:hypothetical protein